MGILSSIFSAISQYNEEYKEKINHYREMYADADENYLRRIYQTASHTKKIAIASILRDRGRGDDIE